ncbi:DUF4974 domain-containing protein [Marinilabiliaceae bacterium JC017]|nr:DUF4974 domain-containing protein [Marinilabiliaceae bacterium JC017]
MKRDMHKIVGRYLSGEANSNDKEVVEARRKESGEFNDGIERLKWYWELKESAPVSTSSFKEKLKVRMRLLPDYQRANVRMIWWKVAAVFFLLLSLGSLFYTSFYDARDLGMAQVITQAGQRSQTVLPDGTKVWLNPGTRLAYDLNKWGDTRDIQLSGEAYFNVTHNEKMPFVVNTQGVDIQVLGTSFNVRSYEAEKRVETTLVEGRVLVSLQEENKGVILKPGEKLVYSTQDKGLDKSRIDPQAVLAWRDGKLVFKRTPFSQFVEKLEQYYDVTIGYNPEDFVGIHYSGTLDNLKIEQVFEVINVTIPLNYRINNDSIQISVIKRKNQ